MQQECRDAYLMKHFAALLVGITPLFTKSTCRYDSGPITGQESNGKLGDRRAVGHSSLTLSEVSQC